MIMILMERILSVSYTHLDVYKRQVFGSPVYYAAASGSITSFLDRAFYSGGKHMAFKPGAVICLSLIHI